VAGETELNKMLASLTPHLMDDDFVFCTIKDAVYGDFAHLSPMASFREAEGLTLLVTRKTADGAGLNYDAAFKCITLGVRSSLQAVGLTAAVSSKLAERGIGANVIAAYHHDHVFVPADKADAALSALEEFNRPSCNAHKAASPLRRAPR
jgi:hypothetical protein